MEGVSERALQLAATAWTKEKTSDKVMDPDLAEAFAGIIDVLLKEPHVEFATKAQLVNELATRTFRD